MKRLFQLSLCSLLALSTFSATSQNPVSKVNWPAGKRFALSLTFDDARMSQVDVGTGLLDRYNVKATFFVVPSNVKQRLEGWKNAAAHGHEIGNHSSRHPCSGNFAWARQNALEEYTLEKMKVELKAANDTIEKMLGVRANTFAYPCGQKFVGRGQNTQSYVPIIAESFILGRGWLDESPNDPAYCDFAQITGMEMDGKTFEQLLPVLKQAAESGLWVVLAGHEMGESGLQTTRMSMLKSLIEYAQNPDNGVWIAPAGAIAKYIREQRK